jgi:hypothetical protein
MRSIGSRNSIRANAVEKILAGKYGGTRAGRTGYDIELEEVLLEVKSCLEWHVTSTRGKRYRHKGRVLIELEKHEEFKNKADERNKKPVYAFVKIPRGVDGKIEEEPNKWFEAWSKWENIDRLVKDPKTRRITKNDWRGWDRTRYYYCVPLKLIFGK